MNTKQYISILMTTALGVISVCTLLAGVELSWIARLSGLMLLAICLYGGYRLHRNNEHTLAEIKAQAAGYQSEIARLHKYLEPLESIHQRVIPIWSRQIESSRVQTEQSINKLSQRFLEMQERLQQVIKGSEQGIHCMADGSTMIDLFDGSQESLSSVINTLESALIEEEKLLDQFRSVARQTKELDVIAANVSEIASQINMLALNTAIEAARAGENGRGFTVVADKIRELAAQSSQTGQKICRKVNAIAESMHATLKTAEQNSTSSKAKTQFGKDTIESVFSVLRETITDLQQESVVLRSAGDSIRSEISEVLVNLQFQDRVSQILTHVRENIETMVNAVTEYIPERGKIGQLIPLDVDLMIDESIGQYSTDEERENHVNKFAAVKTSVNATETTFF